MAQILIVEGNDAIALAMLCKNCGLSPPVGYESKIKFQEKFVKNSGGYNKALSALEDSLDNADLTNIGIIVDANDAGASARWQTIRRILAEKKYAEISLLQADQQMGPKIIQQDNLPKIGIWIMPDNENNGYLEHFLASLVPAGEALWAHATSIVNNLPAAFNELTPTRIGKANLHTWLAWKKEPGKPFGQAVDAHYFDINAAAVQPFLDWFSATFVLGPP